MIEKAQLVKIVNEDRIHDADSVLNEYSHDMSLVNPLKPALVVKPKNAEQITDIVKLAKDTRTPLIPVSSGSPHFRGDTVPSAAAGDPAFALRGYGGQAGCGTGGGQPVC